MCELWSEQGALEKPYRVLNEEVSIVYRLNRVLDDMLTWNPVG